MKKIKILITDEFNRDLLKKFPSGCAVDFNPSITSVALDEIIRHYEIIIISTRLKIQKELLEKAKHTYEMENWNDQKIPEPEIAKSNEKWCKRILKDLKSICHG